MNAQQRHRTRELVRKYSKSGTESLIAFVAETNGTLDACKALLQSTSAEGSIGVEWLQRECADAGVLSDDFLKEVEHIVASFMPNQVIDDHYAILGISADATPEEVKRAYRALSLQYHPDTASPADRNKPEKFIAINKAYRTLMNEDMLSVKGDQKQEWRRKRERKASPEQRKQLFIWLFGLLAVFIVVSSIASINLKKRAMLAGLQESRGAFIPPVARKLPAESSEGEKAKETQQPSQGKAITVEAPRETSAQVSESKSPMTNAEPLPVQPLLPAVSPVSAKPEESELSQNAAETPADDAKKLKVIDDAPVAQQEEKPVETIADTPVKKQETTVANAEKANDKTSDTGDYEKARKEVVDSTEISKPSPQVTKVVHIVKTAPYKVLLKPSTSPTLVAEIEKTDEPEVKSQDVGTVQDVAPVVPPPPLLEEQQKIAEPEKIDENTLLQAKVDRFFEEYVAAYEQRNLMLFSRFFHDTAEENGKPVNSVLPVYIDLFSSTSHLSFQIMDRTISFLNGRIAVDGKFKVGINYSDGSKVAGSGPIHFLLTEGDNGLLIKDMQYEFHAE